MGAFCLFGVKFDAIRARVEKRTRMRIGESLTEFNKRVDEAAEKAFAKASPSQISPAMDAPQFCNDFAELAARTFRVHSVSMRVRKEVGKTKTGKPKLKWVAYDVQPT